MERSTAQHEFRGPAVLEDQDPAWALMVRLETRLEQNTGAFKQLAEWVEWGASPRGTIALDRCSRARAWLSQRDYVTPEDVHAIAFDVLRHRVLLSYEARAEGLDTDGFLRKLIQAVPLP